ncbi:NAD-dependent epimerase/dehydratase family protein [Rhizobium sp. P38BS-XIX]|uniref:NAD-dependent epimerase/dehydratase family protein n=1 Tax=Rhizobium sp. P38BS-XIX TaxID=2726740 RepID=UPI0014577F91|nr:NAD-dependent epimerase/dehydratase family protein [Rhizobium sp. P38BS-XIX]NLR99378.1 NAD-dependent epimerase/dehydratase family protein [Rhizobium sp. P38BS-XIX]
MKETVLVTGGTGFVAGWCIAALLQRGYLVRTTVRDLSKEPAARAAIASIVKDTSNLSFHAAELLDDRGWAEAMAGCDYVLHVASPLSNAPAGDREAFVRPARQGTLRVLKAAVDARVKRVVMTSAAATARPPLELNLVSDETMWADPHDPQFDIYRVSKILAERAAWEFMEANGGATEFSTVLPGAVFGPLLTAGNLGSVRIIRDLLLGKPKFLPRLGFWVVDVRDIADMHVQAMISPDAAGQRFIVAGEFLWLEEIAKALRQGLGARGAKAPIRRMPSILVRLLAPFLRDLRPLVPLIGRKFGLTSQKARKLLGFSPRPSSLTITDCGKSLFDHDLVRNKP